MNKRYLFLLFYTSSDLEQWRPISKLVVDGRCIWL